MEALILVVGDDAIADRVCAELRAGRGFTVSVVAAPHTDEALRDAGVGRAVSILALSSDDERNLAVGLRARMLNPRIRVVLRQFSPQIARKIEQNLPDSTVLSIAAHSAATFAGAALDPGCFFAIRFPEADGEFVGFTRATGSELSVAGLEVAAAEQKLGGRIVALGARSDPPPGASVHADDDVVLFAPVAERRGGRSDGTGRASDRSRARFPRLARGVLHAAAVALRGINPIIRTVTAGAAIFYAITLLFFHFVLHITWETAAFDVAETMTSAGFSDTSVATHGPEVTAGAIVAMIGGTVFTSIFIGYVSSSITRAQWTALQGLRRIRARGHFVVCGGGRTGAAVVDLLIARDKQVVVIESHPDAELLARSRYGSINVLTGDARHENVLALCDVAHATAVIALTNNDAANLEVALAARTLRPDLPLIVRMESRTFADAAAEVFGIVTISPAELTAPAFANLARYPGAVGRVRYGERDRAIVYRHVGNTSEMPLERDAVPLCVWRNRRLIPVRTVDNVRGGDIVLYAQPEEQPAPEPRDATALTPTVPGG